MFMLTMLSQRPAIPKTKTTTATLCTLCFHNQVFLFSLSRLFLFLCDEASGVAFRWVLPADCPVRHQVVWHRALPPLVNETLAAFSHLVLWEDGRTVVCDQVSSRRQNWRDWSCSTPPARNWHLSVARGRPEDRRAKMLARAPSRNCHVPDKVPNFPHLGFREMKKNGWLVAWVFHHASKWYVTSYLGGDLATGDLRRPQEMAVGTKALPQT